MNVLSSVSSNVSYSHQRPLRGEVLALHNNAKLKAMTSIVLDGLLKSQLSCCSADSGGNDLSRQSYVVRLCH